MGLGCLFRGIGTSPFRGIAFPAADDRSRLKTVLAGVRLNIRGKV
jgi:hypothetical protein